MTKLAQLKEKLAALFKEIEEESKAFFKEESKVLFDKYPQMNEFSWTQYTPYFNDGEECTFSVNSYDVKVNGLDEYEGKEEKLPQTLFNQVSKLIASIDEDTMKTMFGDHVKIVVTRKGIEIEEHSHD